MPRRGHKKSRAGCVDCKRRHVKCDETRPSCVNCKVAALRCSYTKSTESSQPSTTPSAEAPAYSPLTPDTASAPSATQHVSSKSTPPANFINLDHLELLHHFSTLTHQSLTAHGDLAVLYRDTAISNGLRYPWLMYAILALSAMHLCRLRPEQNDHYCALASSLQAVGLSQVNNIELKINEDNCVALFMFSTTTGLHSFCDTFSLRDQNFNNFLDKLTSCIQLMRGVRSVMYGGWWDYLRTTPLAGLIAVGSVLEGPVVAESEETKPLWELLSVADVSPASLKTYEDTVEQLQRVFTGEARLAHSEGSMSMVFAWPIMLSTEFNNLLVQRRPEALVVLAYYGVVLHGRREAWAVGDAGQYLIQSITDYLGKHWERWLAWPRTVVSSTLEPTTVNTPV